MMTSTILLDGNNLTIEQLYELGTPGKQIDLTEAAWSGIDKSRAIVDAKIDAPEPIYGITTGFGSFAQVKIPPERVEQLQKNLILSHASGVGEPLALERVRRMLVCRINVLAKGFSGVSRGALQTCINAYNNDCLAMVPIQGTLGASGDLAPLSHMALSLMGKGNMWDEITGSWKPSKEVLARKGVAHLKMKAKDGLALINGTQFISTYGSEAIFRARQLAEQADIIAALTVEALKGSVVPFDPQIHNARPHAGQIKCAKHIRGLLTPLSTIAQSHKCCTKVQDPYSLRCIPQVHGIVYDTLNFVQTVITTELNSATDNPMVFNETGDILSGGNFHGEYPAKALDYLAIATHELGSISERRIERLCNKNLSELPAFLVEEGGVNSGFMIAHCTSAALVSENKTLCHPSSVDSIPTSASQEDHVSMGGWSARKAVRVVENVEKILAIELLSACQGLDFVYKEGLTSTPAINAVHSFVREHVKHWDKDRYMHPDIQKAAELLKRGEIARVANSV